MAMPFSIYSFFHLISPFKMVKSYQRYEQEHCFGVIALQGNVIWLPSPASLSLSLGRAITLALEEILVWDVKTGQVVARLRDGIPPGASNALTLQAPLLVLQLCHHRETNILAAGYADGLIKIWDMTSQLVLINFEGHKSAVSVLRFDRSGTRLCLGLADATIILWDLIGEEGLFKLKGHRAMITGAAFLTMNTGDVDAMEDYIMLVSKDGLIKLWELRSHQCVETHVAHSSECWSMAVSQSMCVTSGNKDQVKVWQIDLTQPDTHKIAEQGSFEKTSKARCNDIAFHPSAAIFYLQNSDRTVEVFRIRSDDEVKRGASRRTKRLKEKGYEDDEIAQQLRDGHVGMMITPLTTVRTAAKVSACTWGAPDAALKRLELLVTLSSNALEYYTVANQTGDWKRAADVEAVKKHSVDLLGHRSDIRAMDMSPDNKLLATASNGELKVWNIKLYNVLRTFSIGGYALCCRFLPGGTLVVVGFKDGALELYDLTTSALIDRVDSAHGGGGNDDASAVWSLDLTSDGKTLVTGGNDRRVKFWEFAVEHEVVAGTTATVARMHLVHRQTLEADEEVLCVRVLGDNRFLAMLLLNNNVQVVFMDLLKLYLTLYGHKLPVLLIDIADDNKLIITSLADKNIKIWGLDFGDCHKSIFAHLDLIMNVRFIPGGHHFFSSGKDGLIKYWDGDKFECIQKLAAHKLEVWCVCISSDGLTVVSTLHDHSIRVWSETDDQVFLEEEREKDMDEQYEHTLLDSLEAPTAAVTGDREDEEDVDNEATAVSKQTVETLKAGERLMEAIDIGLIDVLESEDYQTHLRQFERGLTTVPPVKPNRHTTLLAFSMNGHEYVLSVLEKIRPAQLEDALLVFPFLYLLKMFKFIEIWTNAANATVNVTRLATICKVLYFVVRANAKELVNQRDSAIKNQLVVVKEQLRRQLGATSAQLGYNIEALRFVKQQWKLTHQASFIDEAEQRAFEDLRAKKRVFTTM